MKRLKELLRTIYHFLKRVVYYHYYQDFLRKSHFTVKTSDETVDYIIANRVCVSRFGDGEYAVMNGGGNGMQDADEKLGERLREVLNSSLPNHIVCLPYAFVSAKHMTADARDFWYPNCGKWQRSSILNLTNSKHIYYDASFTRFYIDFKDKSMERIGAFVEKLKRIWYARDLLIVEGTYSRLGVGNDLFDNARSLRRLICPAHGAFSKYDEIMASIQQITPPKVKIA